MTSPNSPAGRPVHQVLGSDFVADCNAEQLQKIAQAIAENPDGVQQIVAIARLSKTVKKPIPFILAKIDSRAHLSIDQTVAESLSDLELAARRYLAHRRRYPDEPKRHAMTYALIGDSSREFEDALRRRLGLAPLPRLTTEVEAARWQRIRRLMAGLAEDHPLRQAVRDTCSPEGDEKSTEDALQVLGYLEAVADDCGLKEPAAADPVGLPVLLDPAANPLDDLPV